MKILLKNKLSILAIGAMLVMGCKQQSDETNMDGAEGADATEISSGDQNMEVPTDTTAAEMEQQVPSGQQRTTDGSSGNNGSNDGSSPDGADGNNGSGSGSGGSGSGAPNP
ncbi:hypothetical protein [Flavobacterium selenitireducens]|uniref:hypothetical protein n=1 Tax=Flavobacterium selenitireducens TaxID=2722704 RepID=UPI00168A5882|nr:hypothetical protein [Flavobacterium selenitireducens]MBD3583077.1 hypothetical protein [Flavobacterium selenitireducens]